ncbi:MAG: hypothetical protein WED33_07595 [Bacteroidia bacterium]
MNAVTRLTALWAFVEAGLGGMLHAFKLPFTGLFVGGLAVLILTLIAHFSHNNIGRILKSLIIVLAVKAIVSPHSPMPAYFAVTFQAILAFGVYRVFKVNYLSIVLVAVISMMESAVQKLIILTVFFGKSFWIAIDSFFASVFDKFGLEINDAGIGIVCLYLSIYFVGGILISIVIIRIIRDLRSFNQAELKGALHLESPKLKSNSKRSRKILIYFFILVFISASLFIFSPNDHSGWISMIKSIAYTLTVLFIWYIILAPILTKVLKNYLNKKSENKQYEITQAIESIPEFRHLARIAWVNSASVNKYQRIRVFISTLIYLTLIPQSISPENKPADL